MLTLQLGILVEQLVQHHKHLIELLSKHYLELVFQIIYIDLNYQKQWSLKKEINYHYIHFQCIIHFTI